MLVGGGTSLSPIFPVFDIVAWLSIVFPHDAREEGQREVRTREKSHPKDDDDEERASDQNSMGSF